MPKKYNIEVLVKKQLDLLIQLIDDGLIGKKKVLIVDIEEASQLSIYIVNHGLKVVSPNYYIKLRELMKKNKYEANKISNETVEKMLSLSKNGKGIDTIAMLLDVDSTTVLRYLKKKLGKEEYEKRHYKGRLGGNKALTFTLPNGQIVQSIQEYKIARKLLSANINFETQKQLEYCNVNNKVCTKFVDFYLPDYNLYIEYAGLMGLNYYKHQVTFKKNLYNQKNIKYLYLYNVTSVNKLIKFLLSYKNDEVLQDILRNIKVPLSKDRIFKTFQCEGKTTGKPAIFVRLSYCNLHCIWCDAFYTWQPAFVNDKEKPDFETLFDIFKEIHKNGENIVNNRRVVLTGGEPLSFQKQLEYLVFELITRGYDVEIETNGTIKPLLFLQDFCQFNVSPKLSNNIVDAKNKRIVGDAINFFNDHKNTIFKFVIESQDDWKEIQEDFIKPFNISNDKIWLMPQASTTEELNSKRSFVVNLALENQVNYSDRLQIMIWGNKRGV
jgi:organic radical activating enzyme